MPQDGDTREASKAPSSSAMAWLKVLINSEPRISAQKSGGEVGNGVCVGDGVFVAVGKDVEVKNTVGVNVAVGICVAVAGGGEAVQAINVKQIKIKKLFFILLFHICQEFIFTKLLLLNLTV